MLSRFRQSQTDLETARRIHGAIVARARSAVFFLQLGAPDTIDGRFDVLTLHVFLVMDTLKHDPTARALSTQLARAAFEGFEDALRELGVGDMGISRRIKAMANAFYGRLEAYSAAGNDEEAMTAALLKNLYRGEEGQRDAAMVLSLYAQRALAHLRQRESLLALREGRVDFGPFPEP